MEKRSESAASETIRAVRVSIAKTSAGIKGGKVVEGVERGLCDCATP